MSSRSKGASAAKSAAVAKSVSATKGATVAKSASAKAGAAKAKATTAKLARVKKVKPGDILPKFRKEALPKPQGYGFFDKLEDLAGSLFKSGAKAPLPPATAPGLVPPAAGLGPALAKAAPGLAKAGAANALGEAAAARISPRELRHLERELRRAARADTPQAPRVDPAPYAHELQNQVLRGELNGRSFLQRFNDPTLLALAGDAASDLRGIRDQLAEQLRRLPSAAPNRWAGPNVPALQPPPGKLPNLSAWRSLLNFRLPRRSLDELARRNRQHAARYQYRPDSPLAPRPYYEHALEDAYGPVNLDYYPVEITKKPRLNGREMSAEEFLEYFRKHINEVIDPGAAHFNPYTVEDALKWQSSNPQDTIFSIPLGSIAKSPFPGSPDPYLRPDHGAVIASEITPRYWRFTTIATPYDLEHAVSGTREFGVTPTAQGYTVYTRGSDRTTGLFDRLVSASSAWYNGDEGAVFEGGNALWESMQQGLVRLVKSLGGEAYIQGGLPISRRYDWNGVKMKYIK